jgi:hypothetical protein
LWALVQIGMVFCGLATIPALANAVLATTVIVQSMDNPNVLAKYVEPERPGPMESLIQVGIALLTALLAIGGCGLCCFTPPRSAAQAAQLAFALAVVSLVSVLVTAVGLASIAADRTKPFLQYALTLTLVSIVLAVVAEFYHIRFFHRLGTSLCVKSLEGTASLTMKTLIAAMILTVLGGIGAYLYGMSASMAAAQRNMGVGIREMTPPPRQLAPDTTVQLLILGPLLVWIFFFLIYFKLLFGAFSAIRSRSRVPQTSA